VEVLIDGKTDELTYLCALAELLYGIRNDVSNGLGRVFDERLGEELCRVSWLHGGDVHGDFPSDGLELRVLSNEVCL
jgi:hypothetical protein